MEANETQRHQIIEAYKKYITTASEIMGCNVHGITTFFTLNDDNTMDQDSVMIASSFGVEKEAIMPNIGILLRYVADPGQFSTTEATKPN